MSGKYLAFYVDGHIYAIESSKILGVILTGPITPMPRVDPSILGVIDLRGSICSVIDLRARLHGEEPAINGSLLAISIAHEEHRACVVVDKVISLIEVSEEDVKPLSPLEAGRFTTSYVVKDGETICLLSLDALFNMRTQMQ